MVSVAAPLSHSRIAATQGLTERLIPKQIKVTRQNGFKHVFIYYFVTFTEFIAICIGLFLNASAVWLYSVIAPLLQLQLCSSTPVK